VRAARDGARFGLPLTTRVADVGAAVRARRARTATVLRTVEWLTFRAFQERGGGCLVVGVIAGEARGVFGWGDSGAEGAGPRESLFEIGSLTKLFTSLLLAEMVEGGLVGFDDPLATCLRASPRAPARVDRRITLAHLATHTAGLPRLPLPLYLRALRSPPDNPYARITVDDVLAALGRTRPWRQVGDRYHYSNFGAGLLGLALASRAGSDYELAVRERLCEPLGLTDTTISVTAAQRARLAVGHSAQGRPVPAWRLPGLAGAGALRSTAADLLRFMDTQLTASPSLLAWAAGQTHRPRVQVSSRLEVGLGWHISPLLGRWRMLWHDGSTGGFASFAGLVKETRVGVVALANTAQPVDGLGLALLEALHRDRRSGGGP
jgi:CubicO group peptidase (beta-lactamase class C family)